MITQINLYKALVNRGYLGKKYYTKYNITNQLEMPIYDTAQLDGVLDTSRISLINNKKTPLRPFTRIIIEITDSDSQTPEKIYRVVDNDKVENVVRGVNPLYRHTVSLVEISKILERRSVDNLTFTNYLHDDTARDMAVEYFINRLKNEKIDDAGISYVNGNRFLGPYHLLGESDTITTNVELSINGISESTTGMLWWKKTTQTLYSLSMTEYYVKLPNGTTQNLSTSGTFTYALPGTYTFSQKYYRKENFISGTTGMLTTITKEWSVLISWKVVCVANAPISVHTYTMNGVVNRIFRCHRALIKNADTQEFSLDNNLVEKLENIPATEFAITEGTLFEALTQVGNKINAIPRLIPRIINNDDYSYWDVVTFDFLDATTEFKKNKYSLIDLENPLDEYAQDFVSNVQNATITNYSGKSSAIEPIRDGFLSTRTESVNYEVSDNEGIFRTREKIKSIVKCVALYDGTTRDITQRILEKSLYNLKSDYDQLNTSDMKSSFLYFIEGENNIFGLNYVNKKALELQTFGQKEAIKNILGISGKIKDIAINIEYIPWLDFKARQYKEYYDKRAEESTLYYNQQANEIDIDYYGKNMFHALAKTGNVKVGKTQYFNSIFKTPRCGQFFRDNGKKYIAFQVNRELACKCPIKASTIWAENYNELYADIAVKSAIRQSEIDRTKCVKRDIDIQNFCIIDTELDLDKCFDTPYAQLSQSEKTKIKTDLWNGFGHPNNLNAFTNHINRTYGQSERLTTAAICRIKYKNPESSRVTKNILCPATFHSFGKSIVCRMKLEDNYSAGTFIDTSGTGRTDVNTGNDSVIEKPSGSYAIENFIQYANRYGRTEYLEFALIDKFNKSNWTKQGAAYYLYDIDNNDYFRLNNNSFNAYVYFGYDDFDNWAVILDKDMREQISVVCQLNFRTPNKNINIYQYFIESLPYICDSDTKYKEVIFYNEQQKDAEEIKGNYYIVKNNLDAVADVNTGTVTIPSTVATANGKGFGLVTKDDKLCIYIKKQISIGDSIPPIHFMFRHNI